MEENEVSGSSLVMEKTNGDEVVVIQETGFNIHIIAPAVEPFDLPVSINCTMKMTSLLLNSLHLFRPAHLLCCHHFPYPNCYNIFLYISVWLEIYCRICVSFAEVSSDIENKYCYRFFAGWALPLPCVSLRT